MSSCSAEDQTATGTGGAGAQSSSDAGNQQDVGVDDDSGSQASDDGGDADSATDAADPFDAAAPPDDPAVSTKVEEILSQLTPAQKLAQMTEIQYEDVSPDSARANCYGSIFNGGEELPFTNNPDSWANALDALQEATIAGCGIPMIYGIDAVHGNAKVIGSTVFPHNIGMGATRDAVLVERVGRATAQECRGVGIHMAFAPSVSVARDERWGRTYESFGETPELNAELGAAYVKGLQGDGDLSDPGAVAATAKHYVGDGGTTDGKNAAVAEFGEATLRAIHLPPYQAAVSQNVAVIMPSYHQWQRDGQTFFESEDKFALTDVLKNELGFKGFCLSDYDAIARTDGAKSPYTEGNVASSVNAGMDMAMVAMDNGIAGWTSSLENADVPQERIDDAVRRILRIKVLMGLFDNDFEKAYSNSMLRSQIWSSEHQELAREAVRKSLVLLKNDGVLPLDKAGAVKVMGRYADSMGAQAGGWTVSWQGSADYDTSKVMGETLLEGLQTVGGNVQSTTSVASGDTVVVVVGEDPYAEGFGDHGASARDGSGRKASVNLLDQNGYSELQSTLSAGAKVVLVILSGRPLVMDASVVDGCSAIVAAWLPGSRGIGVADVLYGDVNFTGKLPHTWPADFAQIPVNVNKQSDEPGNDAANTNVLYPYGYGLSYQ